MHRFLAWSVAALAIVQLATVVVIGQENTVTSFGRWLGPVGISRLDPDHLEFDAPAVATVLDVGARRVLLVHAAEADGLAFFLQGRGTPPSHGAEVGQFVDGLTTFADASRTLAACTTRCRGQALGLNQQGAKLLAQVTVIADAAHRRRW